MLNYRALESVFRALADPTRRAIIERLSDGDASLSDLAEPQSGLIHTEKTGRVRTCRLEPQALGLPDQWITQRRSLWQRRPPRT